jgi:hypothetical protein
MLEEGLADHFFSWGCGRARGGRRRRRLDCEQNIGGDGPEDWHDGRALEFESFLPCKRCSADCSAVDGSRVAGGGVHGVEHAVPAARLLH